MKHFTYFILLFALFTSSFTCGTKSNYEIIYEYQQGIGLAVNVADSIELVRIDDNRDTTRSKIKMEMDNDLFNLSIKIISTGNEDSSLIKMENSPANNGIQTNAKTPDSLVFKNSKWYSYTGNKVKEIANIRNTAKKTGLFKTILGYSAQKYIVLDEGSENRYEVWVCDELPNTLMPGAGYAPFSGAVLEVYFPDRKAYFVAKKITRL